MRRVRTGRARAWALTGGHQRRPAPDGSPFLLHFVVDSLPNAVAVVDTEGRVFAMNEAFRARAKATDTSGELGPDHFGVALMAGVRAAAGSSPSVAIQVLDESGNRFDCRCLDRYNPLVAVVAQGEAVR